MHIQSIIAAEHIPFPKPAAASLTSVFAGQPAERLEAGHPLFWDGDPAHHVFSITEGTLRIYKILGDGRRAITGFVFPGDVIGIAVRDHYAHTVEAVTPVKLKRLSRSRFRDEIGESPVLQRLLVTKLCEQMAAAQDQMTLLGRMTAEERVGRFLLELARKNNEALSDGAAIALPMTRLDIADYLGLTVETVSRIMTKLGRRGLIGNAGRHKVIIRKSDELLELAGYEDNASYEEDYDVKLAWAH